MATPKKMELAGDLRAAAAETLRADLAAALGRGNLRVTTAGLTGVETSIVQVLVAARRSAAQMNRKLTIDIAKDGVLARLLARLGMDDALGA
jgi:anti-anti-sigma regulatory factor